MSAADPLAEWRSWLADNPDHPEVLAVVGAIRRTLAAASEHGAGGRHV